MADRGAGPPDARAAVIDVCNAANDTDAFQELFDLIPSGGTPRPRVTRATGSSAMPSPRRGGPSPRAARCCTPRTSTRWRPTRRRRAVATGRPRVRRLAEEITDYEIGCLQTDVAAVLRAARLGALAGTAGGAGRRRPDPDARPDRRDDPPPAAHAGARPRRAADHRAVSRPASGSDSGGSAVPGTAAASASAAQVAEPDHTVLEHACSPRDRARRGRRR